MVRSCASDEKYWSFRRRGVGRILGALAPALEIAEHRAAAGVGERLNQRVGMLRRVVDLRHVHHRGDAGVELGERAEKRADVDVLGPVDHREFLQDVFVVVEHAVRVAVVDQDAVGEETAERRLELVMVRVDEAGHDDHAGGIDGAGVRGGEVRGRSRQCGCPR